MYEGGHLERKCVSIFSLAFAFQTALKSSKPKSTNDSGNFKALDADFIFFRLGTTVEGSLVNYVFQGRLKK